MSNGTTITYGLEFSMNLGNTKAKADRRAAAIDRSIIDTQMTILRRNLAKELASACGSRDGGIRQLAQARQHIKLLNKKKAAEQVKVTQARSDEVVVLKYTIEALTAQQQEISALKTIRDAEARIRFFIHSYPRDI